MSGINIELVGGKYQAIAPYQMVGAPTGYARPFEVDASRQQVEAALLAAGFARPAQRGGNWYNVPAKRQARICIRVPGTANLKQGEVAVGTIGVELWHEPNAELLA